MLMVATFLAFLTLTAAIIFAILMLFLPSVRELIEPQDAGPRVIPDTFMEKTTNLEDDSSKNSQV
jgi:hypothetical protein